MDLSQVPLLVLEKVRNKWERIHDSHADEDIIHAKCAMCCYALEISDSAFLYGYVCRRHCPIDSECLGLMDCESPGWPERRERFLLAIRAEIERRAGM